MEIFEIFRTKDPQVSSWLQKNGFQKRRSEACLVEIGKKTTKSNQEEIQPPVQTKEVRFYKDGKKPTLPVPGKQTDPEQGRNRIATEMPAIGSSSAKRFVYQELAEPLQAGNIYKREQRMLRSYSSPPNNGHLSLSRRNSTLSLFSDRPSNIPVLIRNNDVRLRKYSCPEYYSTSTNQYYSEINGSRELEAKGFDRRTAANLSNNTSKQLAKAPRNQATREQTDCKKNNSILGVKSKATKKGSALLKKELNDFRQVSVTDYNGNEIFPTRDRQILNSTPDDSYKGFGFEFDAEEESLQSYSLEALPKKPPKQNLPSSMYNARSDMLTWLGEVNRNNPQLWS